MHHYHAADLNQVASFNASYKENLLKLKHFVLIRFLHDSMVVPSESQHFGFYESGQADVVEPLRQSPRLYLRQAGVDDPLRDGGGASIGGVVDDPLGLRQMMADGRLHFVDVPGGHLQMSQDDFDMLIDEYLR